MPSVSSSSDLESRQLRADEAARQADLAVQRSLLIASETPLRSKLADIQSRERDVEDLLMNEVAWTDPATVIDGLQSMEADASDQAQKAKANDERAQSALIDTTRVADRSTEAMQDARVRLAVSETTLAHAQETARSARALSSARPTAANLRRASDAENKVKALQTEVNTARDKVRTCEDAARIAIAARDSAATEAITAHKQAVQTQDRARAIHNRLADARMWDMGMPTASTKRAQAERKVLEGHPNARDEAAFLNSMKGKDWPVVGDLDSPTAQKLSHLRATDPWNRQVRLIEKARAGKLEFANDRAEFEALYRQVALERATAKQVYAANQGEFANLLVSPIDYNSWDEPKVQAQRQTFFHQLVGKDPVRSLMPEVYPSGVDLSKLTPNSHSPLTRVFAHVKAGTATEMEQRIFLDTLHEVYAERARRQVAIASDAYKLPAPISEHVTRDLFGPNAQPSGMANVDRVERDAALTSFWSHYEDKPFMKMSESEQRAQIVSSAEELAYHQGITYSNCNDWARKAYSLAAPELLNDRTQWPQMQQVFPVDAKGQPIPYDDSYMNRNLDPYASVPEGSKAYCEFIDGVRQFDPSYHPPQYNVNPDRRARAERDAITKLQPGDWVSVNNGNGPTEPGNPGTHDEIFLGWVDQPNGVARVAYGSPNKPGYVEAKANLFAEASPVVAMFRPHPNASILPGLPAPHLPASPTALDPPSRMLRV